MKQLLEHIKKKLIATCKASLNEGRKECGMTVKEFALWHFRKGYYCFTDLFDTEEEVLQWLEDEKMI